MSIPKKIHYCWFGGREKPKSVQKYIESWKILEDYEVIEWNETNFDIKSNEFIKFAYENKKWAFVTDYVRLRVLEEHGGIYLDTDVEVKKGFDDLLNNNMFLGFIYDCSIGTAVIGAEAHHKILKDLIKLYESSTFSLSDKKINIKFKGYEKYQTNNNNDIFTIYFLKNIKGFKNINKNQYLECVTVFKKEYFERKTFNSKINYSIHHCYGSWYKEDPNKRSNIARIVNFCIGDVFYDKLQCLIKKKKLPYYKFTL